MATRCFSAEVAGFMISPVGDSADVTLKPLPRNKGERN
jgi:hypothetical protein